MTMKTINTLLSLQEWNNIITVWKLQDVFQEFHHGQQIHYRKMYKRIKESQEYQQNL